MKWNQLPSRRSVLMATLATSFAELYDIVSPKAETRARGAIDEIFADIEHTSGGRLGVSVFDTGSEKRIDYRSQERFPLCSTFKVIAVGGILRHSMSDSGLLERRIEFERKDLVTYSPITAAHLSSGMTVADLCAAAIQYSDNTAANLLMRILGGPEGVTQFARTIGDRTFRLGRWETELNEALPMDNRDTTTPAAMVHSLNKLVLGSVLALPQREQLQVWLKENTVSAARIRAGVPAHWQVGDKTGSGAYGTTNDVGIVWRRNQKPVVMAIYFTQSRKGAPMRNDLVATATRAIVAELMQKDA